MYFCVRWAVDAAGLQQGTEMYDPHGWAKPPTNRDIPIWRYFKPRRFLELLESGKLHFARLDRFPDVFEGVLPPSTVPLAKDGFRHAPRNPGDEVTDWEAFVRWTNRFGKCADYANCWYMNEFESDGMWRTYGAEEIAVRSTFYRLCASLANEPESVHVGELYYFDLAAEQPPTYGNTLAIAYFKRRQYQHERELRAVVIRPPADGNGGPECPDSHPTGIKIAVDLDTLIERVHLAPGLPEAFREQVRGTMDRHGVDKPVQPSSLDERPVLL